MRTLLVGSTCLFFTLICAAKLLSTLANSGYAQEFDLQLSKVKLPPAFRSALMAVGGCGSWPLPIMAQKHHRDFFHSLAGQMIFAAAALIVLLFFAFTYVENL